MTLCAEGNGAQCTCQPDAGILCPYKNHNQPKVPAPENSEERERIITHAQFLIQHGYIKDLPLEKLVEQLIERQKNADKEPDSFDAKIWKD